MKLLHNRAFSTSVSMFTSQAVSAIKAGRNVCIAAGNDCSAFTGLVESLLGSTATKFEKEQKGYFNEVDTVYEEFKKRHGKIRQSGKEPKGAIVLTPSPDGGMQRYSLCKGIDSRKQLRIGRMGSSLQIYAPLINQVLPNNQLHNNIIERAT